MRNHLIFAAALGLGLMLCACTMPSLPFQARDPKVGLNGYGYSEVKTDPSHYALSYSDTNPQGADAYLELRAAQLAEASGYRYFALNDRRSDIVRHRDGDLTFLDVRQHSLSKGGQPGNPIEGIPGNISSYSTRYYYAWGQVALLTDDQARADPGALKVSDVLARQNAVAAP